MLASRINQTLRRFWRNGSGNIAIMFALSVIPILMIVGFAVDFMRASQSKTQVQAVLDAAVLAVAKAEGEPDGQRKGRGVEYFKTNFAANGYEGNALPHFQISQDRIIGTVDLDLPTTVLRLVGTTAMEVNVTAEAMRPTAGTAEISMVLDFSGSMNDSNKFGRMAIVANGFIDSLTTKMSNLSKVEFGLIPFSDMVAFDFPESVIRSDAKLAGEWKKDFFGNWNRVPLLGVGAEYTGCTQDRQYPFNRQDSTPNNNDDTRWGEIYHLWSPTVTVEEACSNFLKGDLKIEAMTTDYPKLKTRISGMRPFANTNIAVGVEFGRHMLTPNIPFTAKPFGTKGNHKFMVVLTDGMETTMGRGPAQAQSIENALDNLNENCKDMKKDGIVIFTIGYDVTDPQITKELEDCASPGRFYLADVAGADLENTFKEISDAIKESLIYLSN